MKSTTRLTSAVFHLTPTRTRCDLIIIANGKKEKIATGLLSPFLAHLKTAQDQIAKGGYSILLEPEAEYDASWFTKSTLERFVRFVSNPEILERVYTIETEIIQIDEAIAMQSRNDVGQIIEEDRQRKSPGGAAKLVPSADEEKAIVLYEPGAQLPAANESGSQEGNSRVQLLKVLETRKTMLQKEQGMAFARAVAAGFDIDQMAPLVSFAECFEASRLMGACSRFIELWKIKHESGQWIDLGAPEELAARSYISTMNSSGFILSTTPTKHDESSQGLGLENNGDSDQAKIADNSVPNGQQEYFQGQYPPLMFPPWAVHGPPGAQTVFPAYPMQGMPYYQAYPGNVPFFQSPHKPMEHSPTNLGYQSGQKRESMDGFNNGLETWEIDRTRSLDGMDEEVSQSRKSRKRNNKKSGVVVIRNINYITKEKRSSSESNTGTDSDNDEDDEGFEGDEHDLMTHNSKKSSNSNGKHQKSVDKLNSHNDTDDGQWKAFQNCLLRGNKEDSHAGNGGMFAMEKGIKMKRRMNTVSDDPLALVAYETGETQDIRMSDTNGITAGMAPRPRGFSDDTLLSRSQNGFGGINDDAGLEFGEANGGKILSQTTHEDFMFGSQQHHRNFRNSSDPLVVNSFDGPIHNMGKDSSQVTADETFIVPFRSMSIDQAGHSDRMAIDIDSEIHGSGENRNKANYEPDDLSLIPERGTERTSVGYDHTLEYEMQVSAAGSKIKGGKGVAVVKGGVKKLDKDPASKVNAGSSSKQRTGGPIRNIKSSKITPLEDARARAEKLRLYKADLQKLKKEKEEEQAKRLEALKLDRQKRIAARGNPVVAKPAVLSPQTKKLPAKLSPIANRGSKFSDSEPGSSSPLQRSKVRLELPKASKSSKLNEGGNNRLTRSSSSLGEPRKESNGVKPDSKASVARIRRLSDPKPSSNPPIALVKTRSAEAVSKRKLSVGSERNKISAIMNLDRSKAASLPELKIKTSKPQVIADHEIDVDDNPIVEKTVVIEKAFPTLNTTEAKSQMQDRFYGNFGQVQKSNMLTGSAPSHAPPSVDVLVRDPNIGQPQNHSGNEVRIVNLEDPPRNTAAEKTYRAPHARASSMEDSFSGQLEYCKAPPVKSGVYKTVDPHVSDIKTLKVDKHPAISGKTLAKESKGFKRLLKFGKKNHSSSSIDTECLDVVATEQLNSSKGISSTNEAHTLKNLISRDESSPSADASQKSSRHFSLFSPFRNKSSEKKQETS